MKENKKATKEIKSYIENILRVCYQDCCDSGHVAESQEDRFNALVDDKISIGKYIEQFCLDLFVAEYQAFYNSELKDSPWIENKNDLANPSVLELPIDFALIEGKLKLADKHKT